MRTLALLALVATAGCAAARSAEAPGVPGSYALESVNGHALPAVSPEEPNLNLLSGGITLLRSGAFTMTVVARPSLQVPPIERVMRGS